MITVMLLLGGVVWSSVAAISQNTAHAIIAAGWLIAFGFSRVAEIIDGVISAKGKKSEG